MRRTDEQNGLYVLLALFLVAGFMYCLCLSPGQLHAQAGGAGQVLTPLELYPDAQTKQLATTYQSLLERIAANVQKHFKPETLHLCARPETYVGGVGFWVNPAKFGQPGRYLGVFAKVYLKDNPFRDDQAGHVAAAMDIYGKDILAMQAEELKTVKDPLILGAALVLVYSKEPLSSQLFAQTSEAMALFVNPQDLMMFTTYRLTLQKLFNQNDLFLFQGKDQVEAVTQYFIQP